MLFGALFAQSQPKRLAVEPLDFRALLFASTVATATVGVRFQEGIGNPILVFLCRP